ncbi:hypothetical protein [Pontibacter beigongshangensis]|uniref:hypothetical protein n=1 Tax=Pontibacter beigongshangensis TaxID=2574733 RepID=UPI0016501710|nr:hypothetical protein [Pontibacter beigongshangensis]
MVFAAPSKFTALPYDTRTMRRSIFFSSLARVRSISFGRRKQKTTALQAILLPLAEGTKKGKPLSGLPFYLDKNLTKHASMLMYRIGLGS